MPHIESDDDQLVAIGKEHTVIEVDHGQLPADVPGHGRALRSTSQASPARGSGTYTISFRYLSSSMTTAQKASFEYAARRLGRMIITKLPPVATPSDLKCDSVPGETLPSTLGDLFIFVSITKIDGVSGVLGKAGPCIIDRNGYPRVGYVEFDVADVNKMISDQTFDAVCVHEISHIIGLGTLWSRNDLVSASTSDPRYKGQYGIAALPSIQGSFMGTPAIQDTGGAGTAGSHWRDTTFGDEMMTAYLSASYQPISALTVQSFRDLGYSVDSSTADSFNVSKSGYSTPNSPYGGETHISPRWFDFDPSSFWNSTTIWIIACVGAAILVILLSCIYSRLKGRQYANKPRVPVSQMRSTSAWQNPTESRTTFTAPNQSSFPVASPYRGAMPVYDPSIPVASPVIISDSQDVNTFLEITRCHDRNKALEYLNQANGQVSIAIQRYFEREHNQLASI